MLVLDQLAEKKIQEALSRGELDNLPGQGKPLPDEDFSWIPETHRMAYKILKNAGFTPPELNLRKLVHQAGQDVKAAPDDIRRRQALKRLHCLYTRLDMMERTSTSLALQEEYFERILKQFEKT